MCQGQYHKNQSDHHNDSIAFDEATKVNGVVITLVPFFTPKARAER